MSRVLTFHYVLTNNQGETLDSSTGKEPLSFLEGGGQIIPGLEEVLCKMKAGDKKKVSVEAEKAYGPINPQLVVKVPREKLPEGNIEIGMRFQAGNQGSPMVFTIVKIEGSDVTLDGNHPLAGQALTFDVEIIAIRQATADELSHGHIHGPGGHHH